LSASFWLVILDRMSDVTRILSAIEQGDPHAGELLLPLVYDELRKLAAHKLAQEKPGQTLQATALVHEAYLRLVPSPRGESGEEPNWESRGHFFAAAAEAMRRILIDNARRKRTEKHGGGRGRVDLDGLELAVELPVDDLTALDEALTQLGQRDPRTAQLVTLHCFGGLSIEEAAQMLALAPRTAYRDWAFARAWLYRAITGSDPQPES
jgi:RNA polymerase sigma factor (TIGR02999 family)